MNDRIKAVVRAAAEIQLFYFQVKALWGDLHTDAAKHRHQVLVDRLQIAIRQLTLEDLAECGVGVG